MIRLEPVNERSFGRILDMKLSPEQNRFVAPNVVSLAQAWLYYQCARLFAIYNDDDIVGFIMLDWDERERTAGVWRFMIAPEHQRKGYGRKAMEAAIKFARDAGTIDLMHLDYVPGNTVAQRRYYSLGFRENGDVDDGEVVMTLPLTDHPRVGTPAAQEDDIEDISDIIEAERRAGRPVPREFSDMASLKGAIADGRVIRISVMGETIGLAMGRAMLISEESLSYLPEAEEKLRGMS